MNEVHWQPHKGKQTEALKLFLEGVAIHRIAKQLETTQQTVGKWVKKGNWKEKLQQQSDRVNDSIIESVEEMKKRHSKVVNLVVGKFLTDLCENKIKVSASEAAKMLQHELELRVPKTISQYNFMKKETNISINLPELLRSIRNGEGI